MVRAVDSGAIGVVIIEEIRIMSGIGKKFTSIISVSLCPKSIFLLPYAPIQASIVYLYSPMCTYCDGLSHCK